MDSLDVVVVGAGPNGLAAAVTMARQGLKVRLYERLDIIGGGATTVELTLPGFWHDVCSAVHPIAFESQFFRDIRLSERVDFYVPDISYGQPLDGGRAAIAHRDLARTVEGLGRDGLAWKSLMGPLVEHVKGVADFTGHQLVRVPKQPMTALRMGLRALEQGTVLRHIRFTEELAPALLAGVSAHSVLNMPSLSTAAAGLMLGTYAHAAGWPIPKGGSQAISDAMAADLVEHGGEIVTGAHIDSLDALPRARALMLDVTPRAFLDMAGDRVPDAYAARLRAFRYGNAVAKVDYALAEPVPWLNDELRRAGTVHLGGTRAEVERAEQQVAAGRHATSPYVLISQPTLFDKTRAPEGKHVLWAYTHVPAGSTLDQAEAVTAQIERFAPGFRDVILATASKTAQDVAEHNPNYIGGDIASGVPDLWQLLKRPVISTDPWRTPVKGVYLCGASTSPGPGVHGLGGWHAARRALRFEFGIRHAHAYQDLRYRGEVRDQDRGQEEG